MKWEFSKIFESFLITEQNDVKIKHLFVSLAPIFAWVNQNNYKVGLALRNVTITLNVSTAYRTIIT